MGYGVLTVWDVVDKGLSVIAVRLLLLGGMFYTVGIIFFVLGMSKPIYHSVWHMFVIIAAAIHWFDVYFYILPIQLLTNTAMTC